MPQPHLLLLLLTASFLSAAASEWPTRITLDIGETVSASRNGGPAHQFRLLSISHQTMPYRRNAEDATIIYAATAQLEVDGAPVTLTARPYQFPTVAGGLRLLIENTKTWSESGTFAATAHPKDLSLTFTNAGESWGPSDTRFPIGEFRWHATTYHNTWMGLVPQDDRIYYHRGEDLGAQPNLLPLLAPRAGVIRAVPEFDVGDADGAWFLFAHMYADHVYVIEGQQVARGEHLAETGGYRNSASDPHLHIHINAPDGSIRNTYPLLAEAYLRDYPDSGLANAGGYQFMVQGQTIVLDGSRSLARPGRSIAGYRWILHDGTQVDGPTTNLTIATPGYFAQELRVTYDDGSEQRDFTPVRVFGDGAGQTGILGLIYQYPVRGINPGTSVTIQHNTWIPGSGVGARTIDFGDGTAPQAFPGTLAHSYAAPGIYTVTIAADTTQVLKTSVLVEGTVPANVPPAVNAGPDRAITLPATASLDGTVSDDGLPAGSSLTQSWSTVSGPGTVTFGDASAVDTTASFSAAGTYVLRLTASDGSLSANDTVTVVVTAAPAGNVAPTVSLTEAYATSRVGTAQTLAAEAQDADGQVASVAFLADGALIGSDATSPWSQAWTPTSSGTQRLTATATDDDGASTTSAVVPVLVAGTTDLVDECGTTAPAFRGAITDGAAEDLGGIQVYGDGTKIVPANTTTPTIIDWTVPGVQSLRLRLAATAGEPVTLVVSASADGTTFTAVATTAEVVGSADVWTVSDVTAAAIPAGTTRIRVSLGVVGAGQSWDAALCRIDFAISSGGPANAAPVVDAGPGRAITLPATASLDGTVSDDGLPAGSTLSQTWTTVSGPGTVTFANASAVDTTAAFSAAGSYVLRLTVSDGSLSANDTVTVVVTAAVAGNVAPSANAGPDRAITLPATASLDGTVSDDGLPAGSSLTQTWNTVSGPGTVTFTNASAVDTTAAFSVAGTYVLRLTASDGTLTANDTVTVVVMPIATATPTPANTLTVTSGSAGGSCGAGALAGLILAVFSLIGLRRR